MTEMSVPVTVVTGTLGAGKTTLLNRLLTGIDDRDIAVLVNDMGELNIDADAIERRVGEEVVELSNGCICCGMAGEFERAITELALGEEFEYLFVEPSGISEPASVAKQFVRGPAAGFYQLASVTTVVDARQFYDAFGEGTIRRRGESEAGVRPLSDLIVDGIEFCDRIVLNKTDLVTDAELDETVETIRTLQPDAELVETEFGAIDPERMLNAEPFDAASVDRSPRWKRALERYDGELDGEHDHAVSDHGGDEHDSKDHGSEDHADDHAHRHPPETYGVESFVYRRRQPFDPEQLVSVLETELDDIVRAKGWLHVGGRPRHALKLSVAGTQTYVDIAGRWIASFEPERRGRYRDTREIEWDDTWGDRETKLVFIGRDLDRAAFVGTLDDCLLCEATPDTPIESAENPFPGVNETELVL